MFASISNALNRRPTAVLLLVAVGLAAFCNSFDGQLVLDDWSVINAKTLDLWSGNWLAVERDTPIKGRPLVAFSFAATYAVVGADTLAYHLFNLAVHLACGLALFGVVGRSLQWEGLPRAVQRAAPQLAFTTALVWLIHPLQTECVNYVSQRTESMAAFFILTSLYGAIRSRTQQTWRWIALAGIASWLGALCKEVAAVGPLLIVLYDLSFRVQTIRETLRQRWPVYATVFSCWLPLAALIYFFPRTTSVGLSERVSILDYALSQCVYIVEYLRLSLWPNSLSIDYGLASKMPLSTTMPSAFVVACLIVITMVAYRRHAVCAYLGVCVFLLLAPTSSVIPIYTEVAAERRMYLPLAAIVVLAVVVGFVACRRLGVLLMNKRHVRGLAMRLPAALVVVVALAFFARTRARNVDYRTPVQLWTQAVEVNPDNVRAWHNMSVKCGQVDYRVGMKVCEAIVERWPGYPDPFLHLGAYYQMAGDYGAALRCLRQAAILNPRNEETQSRIIWLLAGCEEAKFRDGTEALRLATKLVERAPSSPEAQSAFAAACAECGDYAKASAAVRRAFELALAQAPHPTGFADKLVLYDTGRPFRVPSGAPRTLPAPIR